jgi:hypothetical protein
MLGACGGGAPEETAANGAAHAEAPALGVVLSAAEQAKLGIAVGEVQAATFQPSLEGPAHVVDAQTVVGAMAELSRAEAGARASRAALQRARDLFSIDTAVSAETLEAAERQAATDAAELSIARARAALSFGAAAPWLDASRRESLLTALANGATLLVSASFPGGLPEPRPGVLAVRRVGAGARAASWSATELWAGPADPNVPGPTLLALLATPDGLSYGERLTASVQTGQPLPGAVVPLTAVVLAGGVPWCYVRTSDDEFVRRRVELGRPVAQGYFQEQSFTAGERVVIGGAGLLLARELGGGAEEE